MSEELLNALERVLAVWMKTAEEPVMLTARATVLRIAQNIAEGAYDKYETVEDEGRD